MTRPEAAMPHAPTLPPVEDKPPVKLDATPAVPGALPSGPLQAGSVNAPAGASGALASGPLLAATF